MHAYLWLTLIHFTIRGLRQIGTAHEQDLRDDVVGKAISGCTLLLIAAWAVYLLIN